MIPYGKQSIDRKDIEAVIEVLESDLLTTGPKVAAFEKRLCAYTGAKYAVAVANGTAALHLASLALLKPGDIVITTPITFLATANTILYAGAKPLFVDIDETGCLDLDQCEEILRRVSGIKAIYPVHFSGKPVDVERLGALRQKYGVKILEDAAHALGAQYEGGKIGDCRYSDAAIFSFHPVKHITTAEGGAILTNDHRIYERVQMLRNHGIARDNFLDEHLAFDTKGNPNPWYYELHELGYNYRITDIQCALGLSQMQKLDHFLQRRRQIAQRYEEAFANTPIKPLYPYDPQSAYHLFVVRLDFSRLSITKAELFYRMRERGVALQLHYIPIYKQPYYKRLGYRPLPQAERYYEEAFSLPIYPALDEEQQRYVIETLLAVVEEAGR